jgi:hypothetical protein
VIDATPLLRVYAGIRVARLAHEDPISVQRRALLRLVRRAAVTRFGREHGFDAIRSIAGFQARVPLRRYEDFWQLYWQPVFPQLRGVTWPGRIPALALSSGTSTGSTKYIPISPAMARSNRLATLDVLAHHLNNYPRSHLLGGRNFMLGGSTDLRQEAPGVRSGDLSGLAAAAVPPWAQPWFYPPREIALLADWERKIDLLAQYSPAADIRSIAGTPSWLLLFFYRLASRHPEAPRRLSSFYPRLELIIHGGVNFAPYRPRFDPWLEGSKAKLREVYPASEGFIAVADRGPDEGMRIILDRGVFYEFVPVDELPAPSPTRHWIKSAELGVDYALVVSTCAGLWSYVLGDVIRLVDRSPPRLLVTGRTSYFLSAFGEHLTGEEIEQAVLTAAAEVGIGVTEYSVGAETAEARGRHVVVVEFVRPPGCNALDQFGVTLDTALSAANDDYRAHRQGGQMLPPRVVAAREGAFAGWMRGRGRIGGQNKVPRVIGDADLLASLLHAVSPHSG